MPLAPRQVGVIARGAARELIWGLPAVAREVNAWRARALQIPEPAIRADALSALERKRGHTDGAALFWIIPRARSLPLLRLLVAYQVILDFLDSANERGAQVGQANGRQLHLALIDALDPERPISDYYRHHPWREDGGYLPALVESCRANCARLPSYTQIRTLLIQEATRAQVLAINHEPNPVRRDAELRAWAARERRERYEAVRGLSEKSENHQESEVHWCELPGAASASLTIHALLALAAEPGCTDLDAALTRSVYFPWAAAATAMLDSYVDQVEDAINGDHIYIAHYDTPELAEQRIRSLIQRSLTEACELPSGERHALIIASMVAMYLSKDSARTDKMRATTASFINAGGSLTKTLLPILRWWRIAYALRSA